MTATTEHIRLTRRSPAYWRVTFNHPPLNIFGPATIPQLNEIITAIDTDEHLKVVVFDSAVEGCFLTHKVGPHRDLLDEFPYLGPPHDQRPRGCQMGPSSVVR